MSRTASQWYAALVDFLTATPPPMDDAERDELAKGLVMFAAQTLLTSRLDSPTPPIAGCTRVANRMLAAATAALEEECP